MAGDLEATKEHNSSIPEQVAEDTCSNFESGTMTRGWSVNPSRWVVDKVPT